MFGTLRDELREAVDVTEPPFVAQVEEVRRRGSHRRTIGRLKTGGACAVLVGVVAVAVAVLAPQVIEDRTSAAANDFPVISSEKEWEVYPSALATGRLDMSGNCMVLDRSVVFWPKDTQWDANSSQVKLPNGDVIKMGVDFAGGAGFYRPSAGTDVQSMAGAGAWKRLRGCMQETGLDYTVFIHSVYP